MQRQVDRDISRTIVQAIPIEGGNLLSSMHAMVALWSESSFVRKADNRNVLCLTASILTGLDRLDASQQLHGGEEQKASFLYSLSTRGVSLLAGLSQGVGQYLDSADQVARLEGMRVACRFSAITGHELTFPELVEAEKREEMEKQKAQKGAKSSKTNKCGYEQSIKVGFLLSAKKEEADEDEVAKRGEGKGERVARTSLKRTTLA